MGIKLNRNWKIKLIHHTHLDIGYTHTQDEVLKIQFRHLENAMNLVDLHKDKPYNARFRWNPEITWAIDTWIRQATPSEKNRFICMVQEGYIGLDGLYGNLLTGLCRPEELMESFDAKKNFERLTETTIDSAMITDIPGWNWGIVTTLSENGIKYLSSSPNQSDRIGYILKDWSDKPFYWVSPSGEEKVLTFIHGKGYSWFHTGMYNEKNLSRKLKPRRLARYLRKLEKSNYPFDTIILRYNIGADNGPPDVNLSDIVEKWNKDYPNMQISITTTSEAMSSFEKQYADQLPHFKGDITPFWEDGAASTSRETAMAREAGERLTQAKTLVSMTKLGNNKGLFHKAWNNTLLYNEHTWGAYNSISRPDHPFAKSQWAWKRSRAIEALEQSYELLQESTGSKILSPVSYLDQLGRNTHVTDDNAITVFNTHSWPVSQVVKIRTSKNAVVDESGNTMSSQRLSDGQLVFIASDIPTTSSKTFKLKDKEAEVKSRGFAVNNHTLANNHVKVSINELSGTIDSIIYDGKELIKSSELEKFNQYIFATSKWGSFRKSHQPKKINVSVIDDGPVLSTIQIMTDAFRTNSITITITINALSKKIYISNLVDRPTSRKKEGIHFEFPFNLPGGRVKYDTIYGSAVINEDQLKGANKNFICATRWIDVSDEERGVSCALLDAPLFKSGPLVHDPIRSGSPELCGWLRKTTYNGTIYSYIMNNYWMTNYKADQPGETLFRYVFMPHKVFCEYETQRFAIEEAQPLIVTSGSEKSVKSLVTLSDTRIIVTSVQHEDDQLHLRLFNTSTDKVEASIHVEGYDKIEAISPGKMNKLINDRIRLSSKETILLRMQ